MLNKILALGKDELVKGGIVLFIVINLFNLLNYVFHFTMARMLSTENYGILVVLFSFIYIFSVPSEAIQTIISKYTTKFSASNGKIKSILLNSLKKASLASLIFYVIFIPVFVFFSYFLKIDFLLFMLTGAILFGFFLTPIVRGILQGKKKFWMLGLSMNAESITKIIIAVVLVYVFNSVYGAIFATVCSVMIGFLIALFSIKDVIHHEKEKAKLNGVYSYSLPVFVLFLVIVLMYSIDVIIAKRVFSPDLAGKYAVASIIGKMILFGTNSIGKAMFPISSEKKKKHEKKSVFKKSILMVLLLCALALIIFLAFPELLIKILFGSKYIEVSSILIFTGLAFSLLAITNLIILNKISYGKVKNPYFMFSFVIIEIILLALFSQNLFRFSIALCISNILMLIGSFFIKTK